MCGDLRQRPRCRSISRQRESWTYFGALGKSFRGRLIGSRWSSVSSISQRPLDLCLSLVELSLQVKIRSSRVEIESRAVVQHFPDGWTRRYIEQNCLTPDPIVHRLQHDRSPFSWSESYASCSKPANARVVGGEAADFNLVDHFVILIQTLDHPLAAVSFGGMRDDLSDNDQSAHRIRFELCRRASAGSAPAESISNTPVTPREFDCLLWGGEGKTDWEISVILGISRATVRKHILSAREKLGASSKTHAIAIAIRMKILG